MGHYNVFIIKYVKIILFPIFKRMQKDPIYCIFLYLIINTLKCPPIDWMGHYNIFIIKYIKIILCPIFKRKKYISPIFIIIAYENHLASIIKPRSLAIACKSYHAYAIPLCFCHCLPPDWFKKSIYNNKKLGVYVSTHT